MKMSELSDEIKRYKAKGQELKRTLEESLSKLEEYRAFPKEDLDVDILNHLATSTWNEIGECFHITDLLEGWFHGDGVILAKDALDVWNRITALNLSYLWVIDELINYVNGKCSLQKVTRPQYYDRPADFYRNLHH